MIGSFLRTTKVISNFEEKFILNVFFYRKNASGGFSRLLLVCRQLWLAGGGFISNKNNPRHRIPLHVCSWGWAVKPFRDTPLKERRGKMQIRSKDVPARVHHTWGGGVQLLCLHCAVCVCQWLQAHMHKNWRQIIKDKSICLPRSLLFLLTALSSRKQPDMNLRVQQLNAPATEADEQLL